MTISDMFGIEVICSPYMDKRIYRRARTHRKRRIDKKWRKKYGMKFDHMESLPPFQMGNRIVMGTADFNRLRADPRLAGK